MKRLNKRQARKAFDNGATIRLTPCKMYPGDPHGQSFSMSCDYVKECHTQTDGTEIVHDFDKIVRNFEIYNCMYETGYYAHYYLIKEASK